MTCHDGFTLYDLVSYKGRHNEANGEDNRDGNSDNLSSNCGAEGETNDPNILSLRNQQARNFMAILLLSQGVPMILSGDEVLRTQRGNNNGYCQDNDLSWFDWTLTEKNREMLRFVTKMIAFRKRNPCLMRRHFLTGKKKDGAPLPDVTWHGTKLHEPLWNNHDAQILAYTLGRQRGGEEDLYIIFNMSDQRVDMPLPPLSGRAWHCTIDTGQPSPGDIYEPADQVPAKGSFYPVSAHSVVVFESRLRKS